MSETLTSNDLYLAVLPLINISQSFGKTEQALTLYPDRNFATEFFPDEAQSFIDIFKSRANQYLIGGHVTGYECQVEQTDGGRVIVRVTQNVH